MKSGRCPLLYFKSTTLYSPEREVELLLVLASSQGLNFQNTPTVRAELGHLAWVRTHDSRWRCSVSYLEQMIFLCNIPRGSPAGIPGEIMLILIHGQKLALFNKEKWWAYYVCADKMIATYKTKYIKTKQWFGARETTLWYDQRGYMKVNGENCGRHALTHLDVG